MARSLKSILNLIQIEPAIFLIAMGGGIFFNFYQPAFFRRIQEDYWQDAPRDGTSEDLNIYFKIKKVDWDIYRATLTVIPSVISLAYWGAWSDRKGRQINMMLSIFAFVAWSIGGLLVASDQVHAPLWIILCFRLLAGAFGAFSLINVSAFAYYADITADPKNLPVRMTIFSVTALIARFISGLTLVPYVAGLDNATTIGMCTAVGMLTLAFMYLLIRVPQIPPNMIELAREGRLAEYKPHVEKESILAEIWHVFGEAFRVFFRKREGNKRAIIFVLAATLLIFETVLDEEYELLGTYVVGAPLNWHAKEFGYLQAVQAGGGLVAIMFMFVFKRVFRLRNTTLMMIGAISMIGQTFLWGFAKNTMMIYAGTTVGLFGIMVEPAMASFLASFCEPDETGRLFTCFGVMSNIAKVFQTYALNYLYELTVAWNRGFVWFVVGGLGIICLGVILAVNILARATEMRTVNADADEPVEKIH